jgi:hypothetical protein
MRPYSDILRFLIIREQLSLGWKLAFFAVCAALVYGSLTIRQLSVGSTLVTGTVVEDRGGATNGPSASYLTVRLASGETVKANASGEVDYRPGRRVILAEKANKLFGVRTHEFKRYADESGSRATSKTSADPPQ